ncbi:hypothetical protein BDB00DRAFT_862793 [Zychaea mexicana]|uniref:uncharacterized protein n=1 Tax=Zychaea mexicana TaxID=64656 RepID=UPI0022FEDF2D|nr:uncharacterized protein BDB00DRAFT_862793 [Zychaea mexicana]KAI9470428.1 hypothetical protein BDB00DRAFT_862793 [Zychaea mexicana]
MNRMLSSFLCYLLLLLCFTSFVYGESNRRTTSGPTHTIRKPIVDVLKFQERDDDSSVREGETPDTLSKWPMCDGPSSFGCPGYKDSCVKHCEEDLNFNHGVCVPIIAGYKCCCY